MTTKFITEEFEDILRANVVNAMYPNLNKKHQDLIDIYLYGLVQMIATCYGFYQDKNNFITKLQQNSFKDLKWLLTFLLPHMDDKKKPTSELKDLNELYTLRYDKIDSSIRDTLNEYKRDGVGSGTIEDINIVAPKYVFSNLQYGRCIRDADQNKSIKFSERHLQDNYYLLLNTILSSRNKMYVNWIDILPYRLDDYQTSNLYILTRNSIQNGEVMQIDPVIDYPIEQIKNGEQIDVLNNMITGLNIEDIYNTISLDLYESVIKYKWLLFDIGIPNEAADAIPLIRVLDALFTIGSIFDDIDWTMLTVTAQDRFVREWDVIVSVFQKGLEMGNEDILVSFKATRILVKSMVVFFDKKYSKIRSLSKEKKYVPLKRENVYDNVDDYDERMQDVTDDMILTTIKSIQYADLYDFILESIQGFKKTWYAIRMMTPDKKKLSNAIWFKRIKQNEYITFKNVYNFCKSMVHERRNLPPGTTEQKYSRQYTRLPRTWAELNDGSKQLILDRINNDNSDWFNIRTNILFVMQMANPKLVNDASTNLQITNIMRTIHKTIRNDLADILFETSISRGTLSYMVAETDLTNAAVYDMGQESQKKKFVEVLKTRRFYSGNPYGDNAYYYLTEKPYNNTGSYFVKIGDVPENFDYFKTCSTMKTAWYVATTYHWIAQIGFCQRFINNRVNYVTGGTGAGKSTQVPKMYMYYLKAIDRVSDPTVIITVPRTNVATGVSNFVSQELSVPFREFNRDTNEENQFDNDNHYVQYKHMGGDNLDDGSYPKIRFITDGSVLQDAKDPLLKDKKLVDNQYVYLKTNKYDVVIIDEAHEHNANMDMILTLMKNATYYNNKIRLVIMSATMDDDEPIYRRFYRDINDNRKYPLNQWIKQHKLDRINTERRFHISPPGETTRFKIKEIYSPNVNPDVLVASIVNESTSGDVLFFRPGTFDIAESITALNSPGILPDDVIALPYHAQLPKDCRNFIDKIDKTLPSLRISKADNIAEVSRTALTKGKYYYSRCVLIATNIAEASISISTLRFVVDTGLEKTMKFDFERRSNVLLTNYITNASRLQRRGRVGRTAPGTAYYTYNEGELDKNLKQFNISVKDIHQDVMLELLRDPDDYPIFTDLVNSIISGTNINTYFQAAITKPNFKRDFKFNLDSINEYNDLRLDQLLQIIYADYVSHFEERGINVKNDVNANEPNKKKTSAIEDFIESMQEIIEHQYSIDGEIYDYYGDDTQYDYSNAKRPNNMYFSGFDAEQLTDSRGEFYIIHPDELSIKRNINGEVVNADQYAVITNQHIHNDFRQKMISNKIIVFWETLINSGFVGIKSNDVSIKSSVNIDNDVDNRILFRTKLGEYLRYCAGNLTIFKDDALIKMLFYGYGLTKDDIEFEKVLNIVTMLSIAANEPLTKKLIDIASLNIYAEAHNWNSFKKNKYKELFYLQIKKVFGITSGSSTPYVTSDIQLLTKVTAFADSLFLRGKFAANLFKSTHLKKNKFVGENIINIEKGVPTDPNNRGTRLAKKDITQRNKLLTNITNVHKTDILNYLKTQSTTIKQTGLDLITIIKFATDREEVRRVWNDALYDIKNVNDTKKINLTDLRTIMKPYRNYIDELNIDVIKAVLLFAKPYEIKHKIKDTSSSYISIYNPHPDTICSLPPNSTFTDPQYYQQYILNMGENLEQKTIGSILDVSLTDMNLLANIYNNREMRRKFSERFMTSKKKHLHYITYLNTTYPPDESNKYTFVNDDDDNTTYIDFRPRNVPEHLLAISNLNNTAIATYNELKSTQSSRIFSIIESMGVGYTNYRKLLQQL